MNTTQQQDGSVHQGVSKPRTNIVSRVSHARAVVVLEDSSANDDFTEAERTAIDAEMLADKKANGYDRRREEAAARVEIAQRRAQGLPW